MTKDRGNSRMPVDNNPLNEIEEDNGAGVGYNRKNYPTPDTASPATLQLNPTSDVASSHVLCDEEVSQQPWKYEEDGVSLQVANSNYPQHGSGQRPWKAIQEESRLRKESVVDQKSMNRYDQKVYLPETAASTEEQAVLDEKEEIFFQSSEAYFVHVINLWRLGMQGFIDKMDGTVNYNVNATMVDRTSTKTFADEHWRRNPGVLFHCGLNENDYFFPTFLGGFPRDIGSGSFDFPSSGIITPFIMEKLNKRVLKRRGRDQMSFTPELFSENLQAVSLKHISPAASHSSQLYYDLKGDLILPKGKNYYTGDRMGYLGHNECHIKATWADLDGVFITKSDWEEGSSKAISSLSKIYETVKKHRSETLADPAKLESIKSRFAERVKYYQESTKFLEEKIKKYKGYIQLAKEGESFECKELKYSFQRKVQKDSSFNDKDERNKVIWLRKQIRKMEVAQHQYGKMIKAVPASNEQIQELLRKPVDIKRYNVRFGNFENVSEEELKQKVSEIQQDKDKKPDDENNNIFQKIISSIKENPGEFLIFAGIIVAIATSFPYLYPMMAGSIDATVANEAAQHILKALSAITLLTGSLVTPPLVAAISLTISNYIKHAPDRERQAELEKQREVMIREEFGSLDYKVGIEGFKFDRPEDLPYPIPSPSPATLEEIILPKNEGRSVNDSSAINAPSLSADVVFLSNNNSQVETFPPPATIVGGASTSVSQVAESRKSKSTVKS